MSLVPCMNVFGVVALFLCIFAVTAMNLYGLVPHGHTRYGIDASNNFDSFPNALVFLSQMVAGHPYIHVVYELENHDKPFPFFFFGSFNVGWGCDGRDEQLCLCTKPLHSNSGERTATLRVATPPLR